MKDTIIKIFMGFYIIIAVRLTWKILSEPLIINLEMTAFWVLTAILIIGSFLKVFTEGIMKMSILLLCSLSSIIILTFVDDFAHYTFKLFN